MKDKKDKKGLNKPLPPSLEESEKKRRSSLTDTPITSSSSSEGMAGTDQPCSSKTTLRKKRKSSQKKVVMSSSNSPTLHEMQESKFSPVYTKANSFTTNTTATMVAHPRFVSSISKRETAPVTNCSMDIVLNRNAHEFPQITDTKNNEWMRTLRKALADGNHSVFFCGIRYMCIILCRNNPNFKNYTKQQLVQYIVDTLIVNYYDPERQNTVFMDLCATRAKRCSESGHNFCRLARTLLQNMNRSTAQEVLAVSTKNQGRTALHAAVITGDLCQVRVLLEFGVDVNAQDNLSQTPLFFALKNRNLKMVKLLLWAGSDFSHSSNLSEKLCLHARAFDELIVAPWFEQRISAINKKFYQFVSELCRNVFSFRHENALSDLHIMSCNDYSIAHNNYINSVKTDKWLIRSIKLNVRENFDQTENNMAILFILPFCYGNQDEATPADMPFIFRTSLFVEAGQRISHPLQLFPTDPLLQTADEKVFELKPALQNLHNGHIYCYQMPDKVEKQQYTLSANVEVEGLSEHKKRTTLLGLQVFRIKLQDPHLNQKKNN